MATPTKSGTRAPRNARPSPSGATPQTFLPATPHALLSSFLPSRLKSPPRPRPTSTASLPPRVRRARVATRPRPFLRLTAVPPPARLTAAARTTTLCLAAMTDTTVGTILPRARAGRGVAGAVVAAARIARAAPVQGWPTPTSLSRKPFKLPSASRVHTPPTRPARPAFYTAASPISRVSCSMLP